MRMWPHGNAAPQPVRCSALQSPRACGHPDGLTCRVRVLTVLPRPPRRLWSRGGSTSSPRSDHDTSPTARTPAAQPWYLPSLTCSPHSASPSLIDRWGHEVVGRGSVPVLAPGVRMTSPGWIMTTGSPRDRTRPSPSVTDSFSPIEWLCQAVRALPAHEDAEGMSRGVRVHSQRLLRIVEAVQQELGPGR